MLALPLEPISNGGTFTSLGYNLASDNGGGFLMATGDQTNTDPMLGPLQNNGGPTFTHALLPNSPAINHGDPNFAPPPSYDQRGPGYGRVVSGRIDKGSFEVQLPPTNPPTDFNGDGKPDYLLYKAGTRQTAIWYMNNNTLINGVYGPTLSAGWIVAAVADFNRDGKPDLALFNSSTRQTAIWYMNNNIFCEWRVRPHITIRLATGCCR